LSILSAQKISCEKSDRTLFSDLNLELNESSLVHIKGDNGAGKTSLLRILVGLSHAQSGSVFINKVDVHKDQNIASEALIYIGHKLGLSSVLSAIENLHFWASQQAIEISTEEILAVLDVLELTGLEDVPVKHLSAGQQRKVALAKLWLKPLSSLWVLDEPFTALDVHMIACIEHKISEFVNQGGAVVMTSHQPLNLSCNTSVMNLEYQW
jgi:heme exporter protein A